MDNGTFFSITILVRAVLWVGLSANIIRHKLHHHYPLATLYIALAAAAYLIRIISAYAIGTGQPYGHIYFWSAVPEHALAYAILLRCYALPQRLGVKDLHLLFAVPVVIAIEALSPGGSHLIYRSLNVIYFYQTYLALAAIVRLHTTGSTVDRGTGAIIAALLFPATVRSGIWTFHLFDPTPWAYNFTNIGLELADLASWAILALGLRQAHVPTHRSLEKTDPRVGRLQMTALIRYLWRRI